MSFLKTTKFIFFLLISLSWANQNPTEKIAPARFKNGEILIKTSQKSSSLIRLLSSIQAKKKHSFQFIKGLSLYEFSSNLSVDAVKTILIRDNAVEYAEPNYIYHKFDIPNDPDFNKQWALENTENNPGNVDFDINANLMWDTEKGKKQVVVAVIDTGINYEHPDLVDNMWSNPGEIPGNNIDDDKNGFVDDIHGINAIDHTGDPMDDNVHGTHVSGTIGAQGNNTLGISGVAQKVSLLGCKFLDSSGSGRLSDALKCMDYLAHLKTKAENPVNIIASNNSWGGGQKSLAMEEAIKKHQEMDMLFIAAAGNSSKDNDSFTSYPANYKIENVISVASMDKYGELSHFSNYGKESVHVIAPGSNILSTALNNGYRELSGTSMAAPHVAGLAAIIKSHYPDYDYQKIKNLILTGGKPIANLSEKLISGRLIRGADINGYGALTCENQTLITKISPVEDEIVIGAGEKILLKARHINCADNGGDFSVYSHEDYQVILTDSGESGDDIANDGIYSLLWKPKKEGKYELAFGNNIVKVIVHDGTEKSYKAETIDFAYETFEGTALGASDESNHEVSLPFPITFGSLLDTYDTLHVTSNGVMSFTSNKKMSYINKTLPFAKYKTIIAPFWDDLAFTAENADIYFGTLGEEGSRKFVVEWRDFNPYSGNDTGNFQVVFYEDKPDILFSYLDVDFGQDRHSFGASATIGVQERRNKATQYSHDNSSITSETSILFRLE